MSAADAMVAAVGVLCRAYPTVGLLDEAGVLYFSGRSPKELPELTPA